MEKKYLDFEGLIEVFKIVKQRDTQLERDVTLILNGMASQLEQKADKDEIPDINGGSCDCEALNENDIYECSPFYEIWVDLNNEWQPNTYEDNNLEGYEVYESFSNYHVNSGKSKMRIYFKNLPNFSFKYRSDAQSSYDYLVVSKLDTVIPDSVTNSNAYSNASVQYNTRGNQNQWFDAIYNTDRGEHFIEVLYIKNASTNTEPDKGFIAIPN